LASPKGKSAAFAPLSC